MEEIGRNSLEYGRNWKYSVENAVTCVHLFPCLFLPPVLFFSRFARGRGPLEKKKASQARGQRNSFELIYTPRKPRELSSRGSRTRMSMAKARSTRGSGHMQWTRAMRWTRQRQRYAKRVELHSSSGSYHARERESARRKRTRCNVNRYVRTKRTLPAERLTRRISALTEHKATCSRFRVPGLRRGRRRICCRARQQHRGKFSSPPSHHSESSVQQNPKRLQEVSHPRGRGSSK